MRYDDAQKSETFQSTLLYLQEKCESINANIYDKLIGI